MSAALRALEALGDPAKAAEMAAHHKASRVYLGVPVPEVDRLVAGWRAERDVAGRVALAADLWESNVHEARVAAAKLLTQARLAQDEAEVWRETSRWAPDFDALTIADHACKAIERRLSAHPERLGAVETWVEDPNKWVRRAALVSTLPWTKQQHPSVAERAARERILGWAERLTGDRDWFVQKAIGSWLRSLSLRDPARVRAFVAGPGAGLKSVARREALQRLDG